MKLISKRIVTGLSMLLVQFAFATGDDLAQNCAPKDCGAPCPPKPCKPCPAVCFERGYPNTNCCFPAAYNEPANFDLDPCAWDFWFDASFTYWEALQDGMDLGIATTIVGTALPSPQPSSSVLFVDNEYKPGFKIGLGMDLGHDDWSTFAEYAWFRSTTSTGTKAAPASALGGRAIWVLSGWVRPTTDTTPTTTPPLATSISANWTVNMDLLDVGASRPYYQGTHLIFAPFGGVRGQWIRQKLNTSQVSTAQSATGATIDSTSSTSSKSWAVGPRAGLNGKWHLGWGVRFEGDVGGSVLFTQYTSVKNTVSPIVANGPTTGGQFNDYNCLRAGTEMNLGLGWGSYFDCRNYHLDLLATYDFQVFWNQNMMRQLVDSINITVPSSGSINNLYVQGLTLKAQFDF